MTVPITVNAGVTIDRMTIFRALYGLEMALQFQNHPEPYKADARSTVRDDIIQWQPTSF